ncbi:MAG: DUF3696 domain-containing protein [Prevotellaceae bacterium]|jgi:predicted ATPase|nr:DUF3696 domain-containing protein [Prevotellaceae bacterium]
MIQSVELRNFKPIKHKFFPLRKLNVLLGINGSGKSSFIQSLLAIRQSNTLYSGSLTLNGGNFGYVDIGSSKDVRYQYAGKEETIDIVLKFNDNEELNLQFDYAVEQDYLNSKSDLKNIENIKSKEVLFSDNKFQYLNANRIPPQSSHKKSSYAVIHSRNIGNYGEYTTHYIETFYDEDILFENLLHKKSSTNDSITGKTVNKKLLNQINLWLGEISPDISVKTTSVSSTEVLLQYSYVQPNFGFTNPFKPENVGFGISYALHVVTALLSARSGELIIIENPESHIHPRGQAELGKLIALTAQNDVQIIVETHSDHIINGIRVAIKETPDFRKDTILFYFEKKVTDSEQYSKITDIEIDRNGELSDYPKGLLDEWSNQLSKLI